MSRNYCSVYLYQQTLKTEARRLVLILHQYAEDCCVVLLPIFCLRAKWLTGNEVQMSLM